MTTFYSSNGIQVTEAWAKIDGTSYAIRNISSVKVTSSRPSSALAWAIIPALVVGSCSGVLSLNSSPGEVSTSAVVSIVSLGIFVLSLVLELMRPTFYHLVLTTNGGEVKALTSRDKDQAHAVQGAVMTAIEGGVPQESPPPRHSRDRVIEQKVVEREVVKIRCPYCGELNDETSSNCSNCSGSLRG